MASSDDSVPSPSGGTDGKNRRLVVELTPAVYDALTRRTEKEYLNKTTITNRAIQLYAMITDILEAGGKVYVEEKDAKELQRLQIL